MGHILQRLEEQLSVFQNGSNLELMQQEHNPQVQIRTQLHSDSAIGEHLLKNRECAKNYENTKFSILTISCSQFQLQLLEAMYKKIKQPFLCKQKKNYILSATI